MGMYLYSPGRRTMTDMSYRVGTRAIQKRRNGSSTVNIFLFSESKLSINDKEELIKDPEKKTWRNSLRLKWIKGKIKYLLITRVFEQINGQLKLIVIYKILNNFDMIKMTTSRKLPFVKQSKLYSLKIALITE